MNPNRLLAVCLAFGIVALLSGCATVTRGTKDSLVIETSPAGATVKVDGQVAQTPCSIKLSRKFEGPVLIEKIGYDSLTVQITSSPSTAGGAGMAGNVLIGGLIGAGLDVATGATNSLHPNPINVTLERSEPEPNEIPVTAEVTKSPPIDKETPGAVEVEKPEPSMQETSAPATSPST